MALLDVATCHRQIGRDKVDIELYRIGAGVLQPARIVDPAGLRDTVQTGNHRDAERLLGSAHHVEITLRPKAAATVARKKLSASAHPLRRPFGAMFKLIPLRENLLLEDRRQHDGAGTGIFKPAELVEIAIQR